MKAGTVIACLCVATASPIAALTPDLPAQTSTTHRSVEASGSYPMPTGPYGDGSVPAILAEGQVTRTAWRIDAPGLGTLQLVAPLRAQMLAEGWRIGFECETARCGGYDFRFGIDVLPEPLMHVDLGDFRWLTAMRQGPGGPEYLGLMVSRTSSTGFVQLTEVGRATIDGQPATPAGPAEAAPPTGQTPTGGEDLASKLEEGAAVPLDDLRFASGAATLEAGNYPSLAALADWLRGDASRKVRLVGHSDASGEKAANVALSRARAEAVRAALIALPDMRALQVEADGVGPLAPRASNLTPEGQTLNRRVEAMRID